MKSKLTALALITVTALSLAPKPAVANDKGLAIVGGFLGGLIVASAINDSRHDYYPDHHTTVVVTDRNDRCDDRGNDGFWKDVSVRVWVPGYWVEERRHHGRAYRSYVGGYYEFRHDRVWVDYDRHERYDRNDRDDREVAYGYGHRR